MSSKPTQHSTSTLHVPSPRTPTSQSFAKNPPDSMSPPLNLSSEQYLSTKEEYDPTSQHPFSAFYSHPTTRTSFEQAKWESKVHIRVSEQDLEAGSGVAQSEAWPNNPDKAPTKECTVWPGKAQLLRKREALKRSRGCSPLRGLSKKQKFLAHLVIAVLVVGAATGLGIGISKAVGSGIYSTDNQQVPIGSG